MCVLNVQQCDTPVSFGAIPVLCNFAIFIHDPVPNDSKEPCVLSRRGVTAIAPHVTCFIGSLLKTHLEGGNDLPIRCYLQIVCILEYF